MEFSANNLTRGYAVARMGILCEEDAWNCNVENIPDTIQSWGIKHKIAFNRQLNLVNVVMKPKKYWHIMLCYLPLSIDVQCRGGKSSPVQRQYHGTACQGTESQCFPVGRQRPGVGRLRPGCAHEHGQTPESEVELLELLLLTSSGEEAINPAMAQADKAFQKLEFIFWTPDWQS